MLADIGTERAVLSGIARFGKTGLMEVDDIVNVNTFTDSSNQILFKCLKDAADKNPQIDIQSLITSSRELNVYDVVAKSKKDLEFINSLFLFPINFENIRGYGKRLAKLEFARTAQIKHKEAYDALANLKGSESIDEIIGISEKPVFDLLLNSDGKSDEPTLIADGMDEYVQFILNNQVDNVGIPTPWPIYNAAIGGGFRVGGVNMIGARPKCGKAQPLSSIVYTPDGPKTMGDMKVGSVVCTPDGETANVIAVWEHKNKDVYKITFTDGTSTQCCIDHLWKVKKNRRNNKWKILDVKSMLSSGLTESDGRPKWHIEVTQPVFFSKKELRINPYILGLLLGDGTLIKSVGLTTTDNEIKEAFEEYVKERNLSIRQHGISYYSSSKQRKLNSNSIINDIKYYGLFGTTSANKFIPMDYLLSSIEDRKELLRGLLDTDGYLSKTVCEYSTISQSLAYDIKFLVESLGGLCKIKRRYTSCQTGAKCLSYRVSIVFTDNSKLVKLERKRSSSSRRVKPLTRKILSIEKIGKEDCRCITIDSVNQLYITDNFIVTHNSTLAKELIMHVTKKLNIPVLYIDTEMEQRDTFIRTLASSARIPINVIETGKFSKSDLLKGMFLNAYEELKANKLFFYKNVPGKKFEQIMSIIRRWIVKHVGVGNQCLIVYDYFKLMDKGDLSSLKEYEALGYQISDFTNFAKEFNFSTLAFVQLNRQEEISQSDRLRWLCHSFVSFIEKTSEMIGEDGGIQNGNRRMYVHDARFGPKLQPGQHINFQVNGEISQISEIGLKGAADDNEGSNEVV